MHVIRKAYVDTSVGQMHYRYAGAGVSLILLHQTATCSEVYEPLMRELASQFSVVAIDTPGFGMSAAPPQPYMIADYANVVQEILDALHITTAHVFGHLTGASIASEVAASAPSRIEKLMLMRPVCFEPAELPGQLDQVLNGRIPIMQLTEDGSYLQAVWDDLSRRQGAQQLELQTRHREMVWRLKAGPRFFEAPLAVYGFDMSARLPLIEAPTLIVAGEDDALYRSAELATRLLKRAQLQAVPGRGHWIEIEQYQQLASMMRNFLLQ